MATQPDRAALTAPFAEEELRQFEGRGGKTMTYIEDETVMDRLDAAFGVGGWQVQVEAVPLYEGVVKVRLGVMTESADWSWYEDFGYPNQAGGDVLKEAVSDGIRRCGRYLGIARDLYRKRTYEAAQRPQNGQSVRPPAPMAAAPVRSSTVLPQDFDWEELSPVKPTVGATAPVLSGTVAVTDRVSLSDGENWCPVHGLAWVLKPAGTSKAGAPYDAFYACSSKDKPWCKEKPTVQWVKAHTPVPVNA